MARAWGFVGILAALLCDRYRVPIPDIPLRGSGAGFELSEEVWSIE